MSKSDILNKARNLILYSKDSAKRERVEYETRDDQSCSICGEKALYKLSKAKLYFCFGHYERLLDETLIGYIDKYLLERDSLGTIFVTYKGKKINIEILFNEKMMRDIQYQFRDMGFRNCKIDREIFLTIVRSCEGIAYADWLDDKLIAFQVPLHDCLITKQEWEEVKERISQKKIAEKPFKKQQKS